MKNTRRAHHLFRRPWRLLTPLLTLGFALLLVVPFATQITQAANSVSEGTPAPTTSLLAVVPTLLTTEQAMLKLSSAHVEIKGKGTIQTSGAFLPNLAQALPYTLQARGDISLARRQERLQGQVTLAPPRATAQTLKEAERLVGQKLYVQAPTHQWFVLDVAALAALVQANAGAAPSPQDLLRLLQHITAVDHGVSVQHTGARIHHLTLTIDKQALGQGTKAIRQPTLKQALANVQTPTALSVDLFIDATTSLLREVEIKGSVHINVDALLAALGTGQKGTAQAPAPRMLSLTFAMTVTFSKFNHPIKKVVAPHKATPLDLQKFLSI